MRIHIATFVILLFSSNSVNALNSFHIGNSLTNDMLPKGFAAMATEQGFDLQAGFHIRGGMALNYIWDNPDDYTAVAEYGNYVTALSTYAWDYLILQPHYTLGSTLQSDEQAIINFISLNESGPSDNTTYYVYAAWPSRQTSYQAYWDQYIPNEPNQRTNHSRDYFEHLYTNIRYNLNPEQKLYMIPAGEVFYEIDKILHQGEYPDFSSINNFYRDNVHLRRDIGRFTVATTAYATVFRKNPLGIRLPATGFLNPPYYFLQDGTTVMTDDLREMIQETVWDVVTHHPYTGIDIEPVAFANTHIENAQPGESVTFGIYTIEGINAEAEISISAGEYTVNSEDFRNTDGVVFPGDRISLRITAADNHDQTRSFTLNIGTASQLFTVKTATAQSKSGGTCWSLLLCSLLTPVVRL